MNIVLTGYRGTGKSVVSRLLSKELNMEHVSMDSEIVKDVGMSIPEIVDKFGWSVFRDKETDVARHLAGKDGIIIDTGGGVIERPINMELLKKNSIVFWLKASTEKIVSRIKTGTERPALTTGTSFTDEVEEVLARRTPIYRNHSHYEIETDNIMPGEVAEKIIKIFKAA